MDLTSSTKPKKEGKVIYLISVHPGFSSNIQYIFAIDVADNEGMKIALFLFIFWTYCGLI